MDPDALLSEIEVLVELMLSTHGTKEDAVVLAERVNDLNEWLRKGGFKPMAWR